MEAIWVVPVFAVFLGLLFNLGQGSLVRVRTTVVAREAAWQAARTDRELEGRVAARRIGATRVTVASQGKARIPFVGSLGGRAAKLLPVAPRETEVVLDVEFDLPFQNLLPRNPLSERCSILSGFWASREGDEGLFGSALGAIRSGIKLPFER